MRKLLSLTLSLAITLSSAAQEQVRRESKQIERQRVGYQAPPFNKDTEKKVKNVKTVEGSVSLPLHIEPNRRSPLHAGFTSRNRILRVSASEDHGLITEIPQGITKCYKRDGIAYVYANGILMMAQTGYIEITECEDGTVYIKDPVSGYETGSFVKGARSGDVITVPARQPIDYNPDYDTTLSIRWGVMKADGTIGTADDHAEAFTYSIEGDVIRLNGTQRYGASDEDVYYMGVFYDDDDSNTYFGDAESEYVYDPDYLPVSTTLVSLPDGLEIEDWYMTAKNLASSSAPQVVRSIRIASDSNYVYVSGLSAHYPNSWVKGEIRSDSSDELPTVTFAKYQYLGGTGVNKLWTVGYDGDGIVDFVMRYDEESHKLIANNDLVVNGAANDLVVKERYSEVICTLDKPQDITYETGDRIEELPYFNGLENEDEFSTCAVIDANYDASTWELKSDILTGNGFAQYSFNSNNQADDYLVTPAVRIMKGNKYRFSVDVAGSGEDYPEIIEVLTGKKASLESLSTVLMPSTVVISASWETLNIEFEAEEDDYIHFALHVVSDPDRYVLKVDNIKIEQLDDRAPVAVSDMMVVPDPDARLMAVVSFTSPSVTIAQLPLDSVCTVVRRNGEIIDQRVVKAGVRVEVVDSELPISGVYSYEVVATSIDGTACGASTEKEAFVGLDVPYEVSSLTAADLTDRIRFKWEPVSEIGQHGGVVVPNEVEYMVYPVELVEMFGYVFPTVDFSSPLLSAPVKATSVEIEYNTVEGEHDFKYFAVVAQNDSGRSNGEYTSVLKGSPYPVPFRESGLGESFMSTRSDDSNYEQGGGVYYYQDSSDGDGLSFLMDAETPGFLEIESAKIGVKGASHLALLFDYMAYSDAVISVNILASDGTLTELKSFDVHDSYEFSKCRIDLSAFAEMEWLRFFIRGDFDQPGYVVIDNISMLDLYEDNLVAELSAPAEIVAGHTVDLNVKVQNLGLSKAMGYIINFYADGHLLKSEEVMIPLNMYDYSLHVCQYSSSIFDEVGKEIEFKAEVVYEADGHQEDNEVNVHSVLVFPTATPISELDFEVLEDKVILKWTAPENPIAERTEDFESYTDDPYWIVTDGEYMGTWRGWDVDGGNMYGWNETSWPHNGEAAAFGIYNPRKFFDTPTVLSHSGEQCVMFMAVAPGSSRTDRNDDWLVSPLLPECPQTVSFWVSELSGQYGDEEYEVLVSYTDDEPDSFEPLMSAKASTDWQFVSLRLPEGARFFAIRCVSFDTFVMLIDDISYVESFQPTGYNIYEDEQLVASLDAASRSFVCADADHKSYSVSALYGDKESKPVTVKLQGVSVEQIGQSNQPTSRAFGMDGIMIPAERLNSHKGIVLRKGRKTINR